MKIYFAFLFTLLNLHAIAQADTSNNVTGVKPAAYQKNTFTGTLSIGFIDGYRHDYTLPPAFEKGNTTGFSPIYAKVEYGLSNHVSLAAAFAYDAFLYNFGHVYTVYGGTIVRPVVNNTRILSGGLTAYYHFGHTLRNGKLDPFIGLGLSLNNIRYGAFPEGDSTLVKVEHTITPVLKAGARYYINNVFSLYGDVGFDKQSIFSLGASCRFFRRK